MKCNIDDLGGCYCNCKNQKELMKHPMNFCIGKGSILDPMGYVCLVNFGDGETAIFSDRKHGMCEMHELKDN